jgi:hypothetical protein
MPDEIRQINRLVPNLKSLKLDVFRMGKWPQKIFDAVSEFEELVDLTLWFNNKDPYHTKVASRCYARNPLDNCVVQEQMQPVLSFDSGLQIFRYITQRQKSQNYKTLPFMRATGEGVKEVVTG